MKLETKTLQNMVNKAYKGSSNNAVLPLTTLMCIKYENELLTIITSNDNGDYLYIDNGEITADDFYVTVYAEKFVKLINKLSSKYVELNVADSILFVSGNGEYKIELPLDEYGEIINYPDPLGNDTIEYDTDIKLSTFKTILNVNRPSLELKEQSVYNNYYIGDKVISTDRYKICATDLKLFDTPVLLSKSIIDLTDVMSGENVAVTIKDDIIILGTEDCTIYGHLSEGIEEYAIEPITELCDVSVHNECIVDKAELLEILDRLDLFVNAYDNRLINLAFKNNTLAISSKQSSAIETIDYIDKEEMNRLNHQEFNCTTSIDRLKEQVKVVPDNIVIINYGDDKVLKFVTDDVIQVLALNE